MVLSVALSPGKGVKELAANLEIGLNPHGFAGARDLAPVSASRPGVYVAGWLKGECHFLRGNLMVKRRVLYVKGILEKIGMEPERVAMYNLSSAMGRDSPKSRGK